MANDIADLLLRIDATTEGLRRELKKAEQAVSDGSSQIDKNTKKIDQSFDRMSDGVSKSLRLVGTALATLGVGLSVQSVTRYADAWQNATNQLKTVQKDTENLADTQSLLMSVANESRAGFETTANLYTRLSRSTESLNLTQTELIDLTETINKSFAVSGASATEASNAIIQLSQGLAAGALRGEEFNSVSEQSPILMQAIADSLNMTRGELRAFAAEGGITAEIVVKALQEASGSIDDTFSKMSATFEQNMAVARNNLLEFVGSSQVVQRVTGAAGSAMVGLSENVDKVILGMEALTAIVIARLTPAIYANASAYIYANLQLIAYQAALARMAGVSATAAASTAALSGALALIGGPLGAAVLAAAGIYKLIDAYREHEQAIGKTLMTNDEMIESIGLAVDENGNLVDSVEAAAKAAEDYQRKMGITTGAMDAAAIAAEILAGKVGGLARETVGYGKDVKFTLDPMDAHVKAMEDAIRAQEKLQDQYQKTRESMEDSVLALENEMLALEMTSRAAAIFEAVTRATAAGALPAEIAKIAELTAKVYDLKASKEEASQAAEEMRKANEEAARVAAEAWGRTHDFLSESFVDLMNNGGNAFDNIAKSFERMVQRMVAEWAASKLMSVFGMSTPSAGGASTAASVIGNIVKGGGGGIGGMASTAVGVAKTAGSAIVNAAAAVPGWGWAIAAAAAAAAALSKKETPSGNAGFLLRPVGDGERQFDVPAFESGFDPVGFARREDQGAAVAVIDTFRQYDAALTGIARAVGLDVNYSANNFGGFNEKGQGGGTFFGSASEDGRPTSTPIEDQLSQFVGQWIKGLSGQVDQSLINDVLSAGSADEMVKRAAMIAGVDGSHESGLDFVPFDGYRAELHRGERVLTASENKEMSAMSGKMDALMMQVALYSRRMSQVIDDWDSRGLPPERAA